MNDTQKIEELNKRLYDMEQKFYKIHSLAAAIVEYENSPKEANEISNVSEDIAEVIKDIANAGADIVADNPVILAEEG